MSALRTLVLRPVRIASQDEPGIAEPDIAHDMVATFSIVDIFFSYRFKDVSPSRPPGILPFFSIGYCVIEYHATEVELFRNGLVLSNT